MAASTGTTIVPIVLGVSFADWPPATVGNTTMTNQFKSLNGDMKIFVDMSEAGAFHTKLNRELLPRLKAWIGDNPAASDVAIAGETPFPKQASRPGRQKTRTASNAVVPVDAVDPISVPMADEAPSGHSSDRGACSECGEPVLTNQNRQCNPDGTYRHDPCTVATLN